MSYWILFGVLVSYSGFQTNVSVYDPIIFKTADKCLDTLELNKKEFKGNAENLNLRCKKMKVEK